MPLMPDKQRPDGSWIRAYTAADGVQRCTRLGLLYKNLLARCCPEKWEQAKYRTYTGCRSTFADFQDFAGWAVTQIGYACPGHQLDKDVLMKGNKIYSKETCVFVPVGINSLLTRAKAARGGLPMGVDQARHGRNFEVRYRVAGRAVYRGGFATEGAAFACYKEIKEQAIRDAAEKYKNTIDPRAYAALRAYIVEITD